MSGCGGLKDGLKIVALKIAPPAGFSPQIHLLDTHSWGHGASDPGAGWMLWRNRPEVLVVPQCKTPGIPGRGSPHPGHLHPFSPRPGESLWPRRQVQRRIMVLPEADAVRHLMCRQGPGTVDRLLVLA